MHGDLSRRLRSKRKLRKWDGDWGGMQHLNTVLRLAAPFDRSSVFSVTTPLERGIAFAALGNLARSMASPAGVAGLTPHLHTVPYPRHPNPQP